MPRVPVILMERSGQWAAALRIELPEGAIRLIETRSLEECWRRLAEWPRALVAIEVTAERIEAVAAGLRRLERRFPESRAIVLAERGLAACGDLLREAGAIHFASSPREPVQHGRHRPPSGSPIGRVGRSSLAGGGDDAAGGDSGRACLGRSRSRKAHTSARRQRGRTASGQSTPPLPR